MNFTYHARDAGGRIRDGEIVAADEAEATRQLRQDGLYLLAIQETSLAAENAGLAIFEKKVSRADIIYFTNQMAVMIDAGVPLANALEGLGRQTENPTLKKTIERIKRDVEAGDNFSASLARFPRYFDNTYVNLVKASEASGTLGQMLDRVAIQSRNELETRQKVQGALMYPGAMLVMCISVSIFLLTFVFPKITPMFASRNLQLPTPTLVMMAVSNILVNHWYWCVLAASILAGFLVYARRQEWGRLAFDWCWLNVPILGTLIRKVALSRSLRTLATTINAGVPVLEALELSAAVSNNLFYERRWRAAAEKVTSGKQIFEALEGDRLFPSTLLQMIASGESTGKLGHVLNKVSDYFDREVATSIKSTTSLIEPIMVAVMGAVIGTIALAMLLPIFKLSGSHG